jgi:hypothetical protein
METRLLPVKDWDRLKGTEAADASRILDPDETAMIVVEEDDAIVGCWAVTRLVHLEGLWIAPERRDDPTVFRRLLIAAHREVGRYDPPFVVTAAASDDVRELLTHVDARRVEGEMYVIPMKARP